MAKRSSPRSDSRRGSGTLDRRYVAEFAGTLALVLVGCGSIAIGGLSGSSPAGVFQIALAFSFTVIGMAYSIGQISGAHLNPAVTVAMWVAGRMQEKDVLGYIVAQVLGGIAGAGVLVLLLWSKNQTITLTGLNLGQTGWGSGGYSVFSALLAEFIGTLIFTLVILESTASKFIGAMAGLCIGFTLLALHLVFFNITGLSVNPARSFGPAIWVMGNALNQVWLFILAPLAGGAVAGWLHRANLFG